MDMRSAERTQHTEAETPLFIRLSMAALDVNEMCRSTRHDIERVGLIMGSAMVDIEMHKETHRITQSQRDILMDILKEGIDEPTAENNVPVFRIPFPARQAQPSYA